MKITNELNNIAKKLLAHDKTHEAEKVSRIAQDMSMLEGGMEPNMAPNDMTFDPSQDVPTQSFAAESEDPEMAEGTETPTEGGNVPIESFVKMDGEPVAPQNNFRTHKCDVVFKAPLDTEESEMMNYILGIGKELGVEVIKFEWEKLPDEKPKR